jgi:predicted alpha/beta superfamily hydrolase
MQLLCYSESANTFHFWRVMLKHKSSIFKSALFPLIGMAFLCINNPSHAQISKENIVIGEHVKLYSEILGEERSLFVHLPTGYEISPRRYPVLYVLDGGAIFRFSKVTGTVESLAFGNVPKMIIVGIKNTDRERDMFPMKTENDPTSGGGDNFLKFISEELISFVNRNYRTENFRILAGVSNSAFFTVYALLENPDLFSAYIASSPTLLGWFENLMNKKFDELKKQSESFNKSLF